MSLISLTFGERKMSEIKSPHITISTPESRLKETFSKMQFVEGKAEIKKTCTFYAQEEVFALLQVTEGLIGENMKAYYDGRKLQILGIESKYGSYARKGMTVGVTLRGITKDELEQGKLISFKTC